MKHIIKSSRKLKLLAGVSLLVLLAVSVSTILPPAHAQSGFAVGQTDPTSCESGRLGDLIETRYLPGLTQPGNTTFLTDLVDGASPVSSFYVFECAPLEPTDCGEGEVFREHTNRIGNIEASCEADPGLTSNNRPPVLTRDNGPATYSAYGADCTGFGAVQPTGGIEVGGDGLVNFGWTEPDNILDGFGYVIRVINPETRETVATQNAAAGTTSVGFDPESLRNHTSLVWSVEMHDDSSPERTLCRSEANGGNAIGIVTIPGTSSITLGSPDAPEEVAPVCDHFVGTQPTDGMNFGNQDFYWTPMEAATGGYHISVSGCGNEISTTVGGADSYTTTLDLGSLGICFSAQWTVTALDTAGAPICSSTISNARAAGPFEPPPRDRSRNDDDDDDDGGSDEYTPPDDDDGYTPPDEES